MTRWCVFHWNICSGVGIAHRKERVYSVKGIMLFNLAYAFSICLCLNGFSSDGCIFMSRNSNYSFKLRISMHSYGSD